MERPAGRVFVLSLLALSCVVGTVGCAHHQQQTLIERINSDTTLDSDDKQQKIQAAEALILNDDSLTQQQKDKKLEEIGATATAPVPPDVVTGLWMAGAGGVVLLVALVVFKRRQRAAQEEAAARKKSRKSAAAPVVRGATSSGGAPAAQAKHDSASGSSLVYSAGVKPEPPAPVEHLPQNQAEVDAMPYDQRGASFFTSRPLPVDKLSIVKLQVGPHEHRVVATTDEADKIQAGTPPLVRAFTVGERTAPWYEWSEYNPFDHYWAVMDGDWQVSSRRAIACWLPLDQCNPSLEGYYKSSKTSTVADSGESAHPSPTASEDEELIPDGEGLAVSRP